MLLPGPGDARTQHNVMYLILQIPEPLLDNIVSMTFWKPCVDLDGRIQEQSHHKRRQQEHQCVSICRIVCFH